MFWKASSETHCFCLKPTPHLYYYSEAMARRRFFLKHYTHSNLQLNKVCTLWKYSEWWPSSRSNGFQKFFKTLYTFQHTIEQCMRSVKVNWVVGFKQAQWLAEEVFLNIIHIQTYNWTKYAFCESTLSGVLQAVAMGFRRSFSKHYTYSSVQLNKVCLLWKYWVVGCESTLSGGLQAEAMEFFQNIAYNWRRGHWVFKTLYTFKVCDIQAEAIEQNNIQYAKYALLKYCSSTSNVFQKKFFETIYTIKPTIEQSMRSVKVQWVVGFKQKQCVSEIFQNIIHIQTYNWTMNALCQSSLRAGIQAEAMVRRRSFWKHYTHSNLQLNKVCALWK